MPTSTPVPTDTPMPTSTPLPTNSPPLASPWNDRVNENGRLEISLRGLVSDADGDRLTISVVQLPQHGTLQRDDADLFIYIPSEHFYGEDSFTYLVTDGITTDEDRVTIQVIEVNSAPEFTRPSTDIDTESAETDRPYLYALEVVDADPEDVVTIFLEPVTAPSWLSVEMTGERQAELKGTPNADQVGNYTFVITVRDRAGAEDRVNFTIQVIANSVMGHDNVTAAGEIDIPATIDTVTDSLPITSTNDAAGESTSE